MDFRGDERAQPVVIGSLLIFAILILAFSGYQAFVVPNQNADVEFQHSQDVQDDMVDLRIAIVKTAIGDSNTSTGVKLGTRYPIRLIALNPAPPSGTLRTTDPGDIVVNPGQGGRDIDPCPGPDTTRAFVYSPEYNEFHEEAPIVYENTVAYSQHRNGEIREVLKTSQQLVDPESGVIRLVALQGEYSESGTQRVNVDLIRGETNTQDVRDPVITIPTRIMNQETWEEILEGEYTITNFEPGESISFEYGETLEVRCTQVGINREPGSTTDGGDGTASSGITATDITDLEEDTTAQEQSFTFELDGVLEQDQTVTIDLTNATEVDYSTTGPSSSGTANVTEGNGNAELSNNGNDIEFTAGNGGHGGTVVIQVSGVDVEQVPVGTTFEIAFTREDTDQSDTETFEITPSN